MADQTAVPTYAELMDRANRAEEKIVRLISEGERTEERLAEERDTARSQVATLVRVGNRLGDMVAKVVALIGADPEDAGMTPTHVNHVIAEHLALRARVSELEAERDRLLYERDLYRGDAEALRDRLRKVRTVVAVDGDRITIDQALLPLLWTGKPLERADRGA